jgi:hypothetical protein
VLITAASYQRFWTSNPYQKPVPAAWFACKVQNLYRVFHKNTKNNKNEKKQHNYVGSLKASHVWFFVFDLTCVDLWALQFIDRKRTKLFPVSYKGSLEEWFTCVSIGCLSISTSVHILERRLLYRQNFTRVEMKPHGAESFLESS